MGRVAVIGSLNVDYVSYVEEFPKAGETVFAVRLKIAPGGKGANQAYTLARMGADVAMFGALGKDANAEIERKSLERAGVDISRVIDVDAPTGLATIVVDSSGENCIISALGANMLVSADYIAANLPYLEQFDIIIMQLEIPIEAVTFAAAKLKAMGKTIILDPAPAPESLPDELLKNVDYIKPNESELFKLTGIADIESACDALLSRGVGCVLASLGSAGVFIKRAGCESMRLTSENVKAVDTTAAGDSFLAAFTFAVAEGTDVEKAGRFANAVAAIVVQREGAQESIPSYAEIEPIWRSMNV